MHEVMSLFPCLCVTALGAILVVSQAGIAFLMLSLRVCSESVSVNLRLLLWGALLPSPECCWMEPGLQLSSHLSHLQLFFQCGVSAGSRDHPSGSPSSPSPGTTAANTRWWNSVHSENRCEVFRKLSLLLRKSLRASRALRQFSQRFASCLFPPLEIFVTVGYFTLCCCM